VTDFDSFCKKLAETGSRRRLLLRAGAGVLGALAWVSAGSRASAGTDDSPDTPSDGSTPPGATTTAGSTPPDFSTLGLPGANATCGYLGKPPCPGNVCLDGSWSTCCEGERTFPTCQVNFICACADAR
jgi:hypothetical protein